jgi:hypothetical protein
MSCETLVGSNFEEYVARSFDLEHAVYELEAVEIDEAVKGGEIAKQPFTYQDRELGEEDLEDAFFRDWKSQEEEDRERRAAFEGVYHEPEW